MEKIERLHNYLNNKLEGQDLIDFKKQLDTDPELQNELEELEFVLNGFRTLQAEDFEETLKDMPSTEKQLDNLSIAHVTDEKPQAPPLPKNVFSLKNLTLVAASLVLGVLCWNLIPSKQTETQTTLNDFVKQENDNTFKMKLFDSNRSSKDNSTLSNFDSTYNNAISFYKKKEFPSAIVEAEKIPNDHKQFNNAQYLKGYSYFNDSDFATAQKEFKNLFENYLPGSIFAKNEVGWMYVFSTYKIYEKDKSEENKKEVDNAIKLFLNKKTSGYSKKYPKKVEQLKQHLNL